MVGPTRKDGNKKELLLSAMKSPAGSSRMLPAGIISLMENKISMKHIDLCQCPDCFSGKIQSVAGAGCSLEAHEYTEVNETCCWNCGAEKEIKMTRAELAAKMREIVKVLEDFGNPNENIEKMVPILLLPNSEYYLEIKHSPHQSILNK